MSDYRRYFVAGGSFFFTVVTCRRRAIFGCEEARALLRACFDAERMRRAFRIDAIVLLPDHLHAIWSLPEGDADYAERWTKIKGAFSRR